MKESENWEIKKRGRRELVGGKHISFIAWKFTENGDLLVSRHSLIFFW